MSAFQKNDLITVTGGRPCNRMMSFKRKGDTDLMAEIRLQGKRKSKGSPRRSLEGLETVKCIPVEYMIQKNITLSMWTETHCFTVWLSVELLRYEMVHRLSAISFPPGAQTSECTRAHLQILLRACVLNIHGKILIFKIGPTQHLTVYRLSTQDTICSWFSFCGAGGQIFILERAIAVVFIPTMDHVTTCNVTGLC